MIFKHFPTVWESLPHDIQEFCEYQSCVVSTGQIQVQTSYYHFLGKDSDQSSVSIINKKLT